MKLQYISLLLFQVYVLSLFGMSPEERAQFKAQLRAARTSDEMEQVVKNKRQGSRLFSIEFSKDPPGALKFQKKYNDDPVEAAVIGAVEECFFEEMQPYIATGRIPDEAKDSMLERCQRYLWLNPALVTELTTVFNANDNRLRGLQARSIEVQGFERRRRIEQDFQQEMQSVQKWQLKNKIFIGALLGFVVACLAWKLYGTKQEYQNDKDTEADQEDVKKHEIA